MRIADRIAKLEHGSVGLPTLIVTGDEAVQEAEACDREETGYAGSYGRIVRVQPADVWRELCDAYQRRAPVTELDAIMDRMQPAEQIA